MTDYQICARAVRGPMRKWWRRVGLWLIVLVLLINVLNAYMVFHPIHMGIHGVSQAYQPTGIAGYWGLNLFFEVFTWSAIPLSLLLWFLATQRINSALDDLSRGTPEMEFPGRQVLSRLHLGLRQGWWSLGLLAMYIIPEEIIRAFRFSSDPLDWSRATAICLIGICFAFQYSVPVMYFSALMALPRIPRFIPWLWWFGTCGAAWMIHRFSGSYSFIPYCNAEPFDTPWINVPLAVAGIVISLLPLYFISSGKHQKGLKAAAWLSVLIVMQGSGLGIYNLMGDWYYDLGYTIDLILTHVYQIPILAPACWVVSFGNISWYFLGFEGAVALTAHNALQFVLFLFPVIVGHYFLIRWAITPRKKPPSTRRGV